MMKTTKNQMASMIDASIPLYNAIANSRLTRETIAERTGVSVRTVNYWMSGQRIPRLNHMISLANCLGCTIDNLVQGYQ